MKKTILVLLALAIFCSESFAQTPKAKKKSSSYSAATKSNKKKKAKKEPKESPDNNGIDVDRPDKK